MFSKLVWDGLMLKLQTGNEMKPTPPSYPADLGATPKGETEQTSVVMSLFKQSKWHKDSTEPNGIHVGRRWKACSKTGFAAGWWWLCR